MKRMPILFVGHGSPMNAIEENKYSAEWRVLGKKIPRPQAILSISAHWFTDGTRVMDSSSPETIYDMYGFPKELYDVIYKPAGHPQFAHTAKNLIKKDTKIDNTWGIDHGTWSVLCRTYPEADIPVFQLSVDKNASAKEHYQIGRELRELREQGVLIMGSGNVVHNLGRINWNLDGGYPWAEDFDDYIKNSILKRDDEKVINYKQAGSSAELAFTSIDHFAPLLYVLGAAYEDDNVSVFNDSCVLGSISMTSYLLGDIN